MASTGSANRMARASWQAKLSTSALAALLVLLPMRLLAATSPADSLSEADQQCLGCHGSDGLSKELIGGKTLSLHVPGDAFAKSVHGVMGCASCHAEVDLKIHPGKPKAIASSREYSVNMAKLCGGCHEEAVKHNEKGVHATLLAGGSVAAPVCTDCHGSHAVSPRTAYDTCVACHQAGMQAHQKWLPNAGLHLEVVSCAACHAPAAQRMVDLRLYDGAAKKWVAEKEGKPEFESMARAIDTDNNGLDVMELRRLLGQINRDDAVQAKNLRGRIELRTGVEAHQLSGKLQAIKDCSVCHRHGAEPFQNVTVSMVSAEGKPLRYTAQKEVLNSVLTVDALREFYAVGGTRNVLLDGLLLLAVFGGLAVPVGHQILKRIVTRQLARQAQQDAAAQAGEQDHT